MKPQTSVSAVREILDAGGYRMIVPPRLRHLEGLVSLRRQHLPSWKMTREAIDDYVV